WLADQWYVDAKKLAEKAIAMVETGKTRFIPENWAKTYFEWMHNIQPWCISRQLWWGHQIPAWYGPKRGRERPGFIHPHLNDRKVFVGASEEQVRAEAEEYYATEVRIVDYSELQEAVEKFVLDNRENDPPWTGPAPIARDPDVLDTWFSSALWPF